MDKLRKNSNANCIVNRLIMYIIFQESCIKYFMISTIVSFCTKETRNVGLK
jgi:hypothetical protein